MAAITNRLLRLRSNLDSYLRPYPCPIHHHFSSSSEPPPTTSGPEADSETGSSFSSYFKDVKSSLQKEPPRRNRPQSPRIPISFSNPTVPEPPPKIASLKEISKHLSEFRRLSAAPPPSSSDASDASGQPVSLQELYRRNITDGSNPSAATPLGPAAGGKPSFDVIRESIRQLRSSAPSQRSKNDSTGKPIDPFSLARYKESLKLKPGGMNSDPVIIGGSDTVPASIIGKDKKGRGDKDYAGAALRRTEFVLTHSYQDLGKKLEMLRPENKKGKWFSLQELNERLVKLREIEDEEMEARNSGFPYKDLRESLQSLNLSKEEQARKNAMQRFEVMGHLGGTPNYMLSPPKEHLVERYFHPDHMSSAEKLKLELKKVRDEFKMSESDCGSTRVQVAQLTTKIKHLSTVLRKKDKHSRKGLQEMVQRRKKLLKYLRRTDWDSYCLVLSKLGLRDNPDFKA